MIPLELLFVDRKSQRTFSTILCVSSWTNILLRLFDCRLWCYSADRRQDHSATLHCSRPQDWRDSAVVWEESHHLWLRRVHKALVSGQSGHCDWQENRRVDLVAGSASSDYSSVAPVEWEEPSRNLYWQFTKLFALGSTTACNWLQATNVVPAWGIALRSPNGIELFSSAL